MATIVTRSGKGSPLTSTEVDTNFTNLNTDKQEVLSEGSFANGDKTKLDGIATSATANPNALDNVSEDSSPSLGGDLDANGNDIKLDANEKIYFGDSDDPDANWIGYNTANNNLQFQATSSNGGWEFDPQNGGTYSFKLSAPSGAGGWAIDVLGNSTGGTITTNYSNSSNPVYFQKNGTTKISFLNTGAVRLANLDINGAYTFPTADGSASQVLQTDGSGSLSFATVSGGGGGGSSGETLMSSGTVTNVSSIDFDSSVLTGYESYRIVLSNVTPTVDTRELRMRVGTANTALTSGIYQQSIYQYGMRTTGSQLSTTANSANNGFFWITTNTNGMGTNTGENLYAEIYLPNPNSTTGYKHAVCRVSNFSYYPAIIGQRISAMAVRTQSALNFVTLYSEQGNIATATYRLYGHS